MHINSQTLFPVSDRLERLKGGRLPGFCGENYEYLAGLLPKYINAYKLAKQQAHELGLNFREPEKFEAARIPDDAKELFIPGLNKFSYAALVNTITQYDNTLKQIEKIIKKACGAIEAS